MKHLKFIIMMLVVANIAFVTSCKKDDESSEPVNESPNLNLAGDGDNIAADVTLEPGSAIQVTITASENAETKKNLSSITITREYSGQVNTVLDSSFNEKTFGPYTYFATALTTEETDKWTITVTDKDGKTSSKGFTITTEGPVVTTPLASENTGNFFHILGKNHGAYDMVGHATVSAASGDGTKDMKNTDEAGTFNGSWVSANGTTYAKVSGSYADYTTVEGALEAYNAGSASITVANPAAGDVYIAKLRGGSDILVIGITAVDAANNECDCTNKGKITFKYKGK